MNSQNDEKRILFGWVAKTTAINVFLVAICFIGIIVAMIGTYRGGTDLSTDIIGNWRCEQFYKNQESFMVPDSQKIEVNIEENGNISLVGSANASIFRNANRVGTYQIEGGSTLIIDMGNEKWTCACVFTQDGLLRMTIPEIQTVLYLEKVGK